MPNSVITIKQVQRPVSSLGRGRLDRKAGGWLGLAGLLLALISHQWPVVSAELTMISPTGYGGGEQLQSAGNPANFDVSGFRNLYEAIAAHPSLREFASICEAHEVKQILSLDKMALTVFAPIDSSLGDLLAKSKSSKSSISLIELAKHHIAQGLVAPDENTKFPLQFSTYSSLSPVYLTQAQQANGQQQVFANNARILATYLIPIEPNSDKYQTLHIVDALLEFAYLNRKAQLRQSSVGSSMSSMSQAKRTATRKGPISLDDLAGGAHEGADLAVSEFYDRFGHLQANQAQVDLYHARAFKSESPAKRLELNRDEFNLDRLGQVLRQFQQLRGRLYQVNESTSFNTYFLPLNSLELDRILEGPAGGSALTFEAHVIPDQVLFTRAMGLGRAQESLFGRDGTTGNQRVSLSLAKTLPVAYGEESESAEAISRRLLATPLLLQAECKLTGGLYRAGVTSAEILVANIPLSNGVLHLIKRPILLTGDTNLLDFINDNDNALSNVVNSLGSLTSAQSGKSLPARESGQQEKQQQQQQELSVSKFRELLAREREVLSTLAMARAGNKTILAPSDKAFAKLKYSLRALVTGDESLIPKHWDPSYRQDLLERLARRHIVLQQAITSDQMEAQAGNGLQAISENGKVLSFSRGGRECDFQVESDNTRACLIHRDLIGTNGVLHIVDRVLGEEQETIHSLLESLVLKYNHSLEESNLSSAELAQLVHTNLRQSAEYNQISSTSGPNEADQQQQQRPGQEASPELAVISKSIGHYLDEISGSSKHQLLASSVNISYQLAKLTSQAEGLEDWNDKFKREEATFTYFVPSDLAWLRLQQSQPELYRPLQHFLEQSEPTASVAGLEEPGQSAEASRVARALRPSQSSHRLHKILERHLVNRRITKRELNQMDSVQTLGATLRLADLAGSNRQQQQQQLTVKLTSSSHVPLTQPPTEDNNHSPGTFAAFHSIVTGTNQAAGATSGDSSLKPILKSLKLGASASANIVEAREASNGFVYIIDNVLLLPEDTEYIVQTQQSPEISSSMSSLLGAHNSAFLDFMQTLLAPSPFNMSANSILILCGTLILAIAILLILAMVLLVRRSRQNKSNSHQQLENGLTSSSSANSGSTSTTKSL